MILRVGPPEAVVIILTPVAAVASVPTSSTRSSDFWTTCVTRSDFPSVRVASTPEKIARTSSASNSGRSCCSPRSSKRGRYSSTCIVRSGARRFSRVSAASSASRPRVCGSTSSALIPLARYRKRHSWAVAVSVYSTRFRRNISGSFLSPPKPRNGVSSVRPKRYSQSARKCSADASNTSKSTLSTSSPIAPSVALRTHAFTYYALCSWCTSAPARFRSSSANPGDILPNVRSNSAATARTPPSALNTRSACSAGSRSKRSSYNISRTAASSEQHPKSNSACSSDAGE